MYYKMLTVLLFAFSPLVYSEELKIPWERDFHHSQKTVKDGNSKTWRAGVAENKCEKKIEEAALPLKGTLRWSNRSTQSS